MMSMQFLPPLIMGPEYFAGTITFGAIGQANVLFSSLMVAMTTIAAQLDTISTLGAQAVRVQQLQRTLVRMKSDAAAQAIEVQELPTFSKFRADSPIDDLLCLQLRDVTVHAPS